MNLTEKYIGFADVKYIFEYVDTDSFDSLPMEKCKQCYAVCLYEGKMVIVYKEKKQTWGLIGGTIEKGETFEQTLKREIKEESNMEVLKFLPIGYQKVIDTRDNSFIYQLRFVCTARPFGPFVSDPDISITKIELIDPKDYKQYFYWGKIGERIISRALKLMSKLK